MDELKRLAEYEYYSTFPVIKKDSDNLPNVIRSESEYAERRAERAVSKDCFYG